MTVMNWFWLWMGVNAVVALIFVIRGIRHLGEDVSADEDEE